MGARLHIEYLLFLIWIAIAGVPALAQQSDRPIVNISFPEEETLIRANVPVFGLAYVPNPKVALKNWRLEYGKGRNPSEWIKIKESTEALSSDPHVEGKVVWSLNKEPEGNITNWAVGLGSYSYSTWGKNLNGIYTLRLTAESENGAVSETRRTLLVGEAILRLYGGTGISSDLKCRLMIAPFSFDGIAARVAVIVKQVPPEGFGKLKTLSGSEEIPPLTNEIYATTASEFTLGSAIYRIYPNGLQTEPSATLEIDLDPVEYSASGASLASGDASLYQWNTVAEVWEPLPTEWLGNTARAQVGAFSAGKTFVALMKRRSRVSFKDIRWGGQTALSGHWQGITSPRAKVVVSGGDEEQTTYSDAHGFFRLAYRLRPGTQQYTFQFIPLEGDVFRNTTTLVQKSGEVVVLTLPTLTTLGTPFQTAERNALLICRDNQAVSSSVKEPRSVLARVSHRNSQQSLSVELAELVPGTGSFVGALTDESDVGNVISSDSVPITRVPWKLSHGEKVTATVGASNISFDVKDLDVPEISISSPTHPSLLFANPSSGIKLKGGTLHSLSDISVVDGAWRIAGAPGEIESSRNVEWPINSFSTKAWPFIGFTYKLYNPAPWQIILRSQGKMASFHLGCKDAWFDPYASSDALISDGNWHGWQRNLQEGNFDKIDAISFGSWFEKAYLRPDPSFTNARRGAIHIRNIWIGKSHESRNVEIRWQARDASSLQSVEWWVDQLNESDGNIQAESEFLRRKEDFPKTMEGTCQFTLPRDGHWYFHLRATDVAGNTSSVTSYPLVISSHQGRTEQALTAFVSQAPPQKAEWKQPDGKFQIKIPGVGTSLNPSTLKLEIGTVVYPLKGPDWNSATGILQISFENFSHEAPLGFDGEELPAILRGDDLSGKPLIAQAISIKIRSPFRWHPTSEGGTLHAPAEDFSRRWVAYWKNPNAPWMKHFPESINNILVVAKPPKTIRDETEKWQRPIFVASEGDNYLFLEETWESPTSKLLPPKDTLNKAAFDANGAPFSSTERPLISRPEKRSWIYVQSPSDPFEQGMLRMTTGKTKELPTRIARVTISEAIETLDLQTNNSIRLDGWLPPGKGQFILIAPGKRTVSYAMGNERNYRSAKNSRIQLTGQSDWTRFSVIITPDRDLKKAPKAALRGTFYH